VKEALRVPERRPQQHEELGQKGRRRDAELGFWFPLEAAEARFEFGGNEQGSNAHRIPCFPIMVDEPGFAAARLITKAQAAGIAGYRANEAV
jgi:hypothetical protein